MQLMKYCSLRIKPARVCNTLGLHAGSRLICAILLYNMAKIGLPDPPGMREEANCYQCQRQKMIEMNRSMRQKKRS